MSSPEGSGLIRTESVRELHFEYPEGTVPEYSDQQLSETQNWMKNLRIAWPWGRDSERDREYCRWIRARSEFEERRVAYILQKNNGPLDPLPPVWKTQENTYGMFTCQITSALNGLRLLGVEGIDEITEEKIIDGLGGAAFANSHPNGIALMNLVSALGIIAPEVGFKYSNSLSEMIEASENGAAVMLPISPGHEGLIPPGHRISQRGNSEMFMQVIDPLNTTPQMIPIRSLVRSEITVAGPLENNVLIMDLSNKHTRTIPKITTALHDDYGKITTLSIRRQNAPIETVHDTHKIETVSVRRGKAAVPPITTASRERQRIPQIKTVKKK